MLTQRGAKPCFPIFSYGKKNLAKGGHISMPPNTPLFKTNIISPGTCRWKPTYMRSWGFNIQYSKGAIARKSSTSIYRLFRHSLFIYFFVTIMSQLCHNYVTIMSQLLCHFLHVIAFCGSPRFLILSWTTKDLDNFWILSFWHRWAWAPWK